MYVHLAVRAIYPTFMQYVLNKTKACYVGVFVGNVVGIQETMSPSETGNSVTRMCVPWN